MAKPEYQVILTGNVLDDFDRDSVVTSAAKLFKCTETQALRFVSGKPTRLKKVMNQPLAQKYVERLVVAGIGCRLAQAKSQIKKPAESKLIELVGAASDAPIPAAKKIEREKTQAPVQHSISLEDTLHPNRVMALSSSPGVKLSLEPTELKEETPSNVSPPSDKVLPLAAQKIVASFTCPKCEKPQPKSKECVYCGIIFSKYQPPTSLIEGLDQDDGEPLDEWEELELFVGEDIDKYRHKFLAISKNEGRYVPQWHWPAFLSPISWLIYRKLYVWAAFACVIMSILPLIATTSIVIASGLLANFLYYKHAKKSISKIAAQGDSRRSEIVETGGTHTMLFTVGVSVLAGFLMATVMYFVAFKPMLDKIKPVVHESLMESIDDMENISKIDDPRAKTTKVNMLLLKSSLLIQKEVMRANDQEFVVPEDMDGVVAMLGLQSNAVIDAWGTRLDFRYQEGRMIFISAGQDLTLDTTDDIIVATSD